MNVVGAICWTAFVGVALFFNKPDNQSNSTLATLTGMYLAVVVVPGFASRVLGGRRKPLARIMRVANWAQIGLWAFSAAWAVIMMPRVLVQALLGAVAFVACERLLTHYGVLCLLLFGLPIVVLLLLFVLGTLGLVAYGVSVGFMSLPAGGVIVVGAIIIAAAVKSRRN